MYTNIEQKEASLKILREKRIELSTEIKRLNNALIQQKFRERRKEA